MATRVYTYTGDGSEHLQGIPARHLTDEDVAAFDVDQKQLLKAHLKLAHPIYKEASSRAAVPDAAAARSDKEGSR